MKKAIITAAASVILLLALVTGCAERSNPFLPYLVPTPAAGCDNAQSMGTKMGDIEYCDVGKDTVWVSIHQANNSGAVTNISVKSASSGDVKVGLYDQSYNLISESEIVRVNKDWNLISIPKVTINSGQYYGIAVKVFGGMKLFSIAESGDSQSATPSLYIFQSIGDAFPAYLAPGSQQEYRYTTLLIYADYCPL